MIRNVAEQKYVVMDTNFDKYILRHDFWNLNCHRKSNVKYIHAKK